MRSRAIVLGIWAAIPFTTAQNSSDTVPILSSQQLQGPEFVGSPASGNPLKPKVIFEPQITHLHADGGNTGSNDQDGPLGNAVTNSSIANGIVGDMLWGRGDVLFGPVVQQPITGTPRLGIAAYDPVTLKALAEWYTPDGNDSITPTYNQLRLEDSTMLIKSTFNWIYTIKRVDENGATRLEATRSFDLNEYLEPEEEIIVNAFDSNGNIWFTSGTLGQASRTQPTSSTFGYITPDDEIVTMKLPTQVAENSFAVNGTNVFLQTGPPENSTSPTGYLLSMHANAPAKSIDVLWNVTYDAGTKAKPGFFARGGGSSPSLMGREYFAVTDNADDQISLLVVHQEKAADGEDQIFCKVPLFEKGASATDVRVTTHFDGENYAVAITNTYGCPHLFTQRTEEQQNNADNDMTAMPGGIQQVQVTPEGCSVKWSSDLRVKSVPILSTATGIYYAYIQDAELATQGQYVWYVVAMDWNTGEVLWKARTGAGEPYNDNFAVAYLQKGILFQAVLGGFAMMEDKRY